ncbi:MAG: amidase family protein [Pseudomonadota bacterium]
MQSGPSEPCDLSAREARRLIGAKALSPVALMESCLARIDAVNPALNAIVTLDRERALAGAREAEAAVATGKPLGALHGLPVAIKDNRAVAGMRCTSGSLIHAQDVPTADEPGVARLRAAGAIPFAKTNLPEFGAGANTVNRVFGATGNPFDPSKTSAGSSGGSAVALAVGMAPLATGSDYGGSLRTPAVFCGVSGFRPSFGTVPAPGSAAVLSPWGVNGPMGRDLADAALLFDAQVDHDLRDPWSLPDPGPVDPVDLAALRVAFSPDLGCCPVDAGIAALFRARMGRIGGLFARMEEATPDFGPIHDVFEITRACAFATNMRELVESRRDELDRNVIDNVERGAAYSLYDVAWAQAEQTKAYRRFLAFFEEQDILIIPGASVAPFPHAQLFVEEINGEAMPTYMRWLSLTYAPTLCFATVAAIPCGRDEGGMPFGLQIVGPHRSDRRVLAIARALEDALARDPETARPLPDLAALASAPAMPRPAEVPA